MGFFDAIKDKAGAVAADTQRAGRVTAAQARMVVLQNDLKKAEREVGRAAFDLAERGELDHPDLAPAVERMRATMAEVHGKEAEIAALRGEAAPEETPRAATPATAPMAAATTAPVVPVAPEEAAATLETAAGPVTVASSAVMAAAAAEAEVQAAAAAEPAPKPFVAKKTTTKKAPTGKTAARKTAAKAPAAKKASAKKTAVKATPKKTAAKAGATPKKPTRSSSYGPRPAGKNRPAGS